MELAVFVSLGLNLVVALWVGFLLLRSRSSNDGALPDFRQELHAAVAQTRTDLGQQRTELHQVLAGVRDSIDQRLAASTAAEQQFQTAIDVKFDAMRREIQERLDAMVRRIQTLTESNSEKHDDLQKAMRSELEALRKGNEEKLEKMRETVDEKLQGTLEKRLGESFKLVSDRLEKVQLGLGEMQTLASDVGGLKRVLTNVKSRGTWGEVQLERQLEDILSHGQYERNVVIKTGTRESVEFAIRLPGAVDGETVYLPIDSKFPQEDYERLLDVQDDGEKEAVVAAIKNLERAIVAQAKIISEKYISPPASTDFAIMYLPTEGLFAEVIRIPGLVSLLQNQHRVVVSGPTMFATLLNSLQMGFRTLAIEKRSSEVWQVLSAAKAEFKKYGDVWDKLGRQLETAQNTVKEAGVRTRAVERQLKDVESFDSTEAITATVFDDIVETTATEREPDIDD